MSAPEPTAISPIFGRLSLDVLPLHEPIVVATFIAVVPMMVSALGLLFGQRPNRLELAGMLVGALTVIIWKQFGWLGLYEIIPGFLFATLAIVLFSLLDKAPSKAMLDRFAEAVQEFQSPMADAIAAK